MQLSEECIRLKEVLGRAEKRLPLSEDEMCQLLSLRDEEHVERLFQAARTMRQRSFKNKVFLYGFLYFNTACSNDCLFCQYRKGNGKAIRYRKSAETIGTIIDRMQESGIHLVDLTMGELADGSEAARQEYGRLSGFIHEIRHKSDVPVMVSPGVVNPAVLQDLAGAGADWYACYQETYNRRLFDRVRPGQGFHRRISAKLLARELGMHIEEGMLIGLGESINDRVATILGMQDLPANQVRVMTLVPHPHTPMAGMARIPEIEELVTIAVMRLVMPDRLIPASLDVGGLAGLRRRLDAGANVVTSLIVPGMGLAGVANSELDIEEARRTPHAIAPVLAGCGLEAAPVGALRKWLESRKGQVAGERRAA